MVLVTPTSTAVTGAGSSATINAGGSVSFTACATLSLNGVFTSTYDNYAIVYWAKATTGTAYEYIRFRWRAGGVDNSTASTYVQQVLEAYSTTVSGTRVTTDYGAFGPTDETANLRPSGAYTTFYGPYLTQPTVSRCVSAGSADNAWIGDDVTIQTQSISFDGFTMYVTTGGITGRVCVYGMRK